MNIFIKFGKSKRLLRRAILDADSSNERQMHRNLGCDDFACFNVEIKVTPPAEK